MRPSRTEVFVQFLARRRKWDVMAKFAMEMVEIDRDCRDKIEELEKAAVAKAKAQGPKAMFLLWCRKVLQSI